MPALSWILTPLYVEKNVVKNFEGEKWITLLKICYTDTVKI